MFGACKNKLLVYDLYICLILMLFLANPPTPKKTLKPAPEQHFHFAHAMTAFQMLLWLMTLGETLTAALGFCCDCL